MSLITFTCASPSASWTPSRNPKYDGYAQTEEHYQPLDFAGSDLYSYDHGHTHGRTLEWSALPAAEMTTLLAFVAAMHGGVHTFTFTDYDSTTYTARIISQALTYRSILNGFYAVTLEIEVL